MTDGDIDHLIHSKLDASQYGTGGCEVECLFIARTAHPDPISTSRIEGTFFNSQLYSICGNIGTFHNGVLTDARTTMKGNFNLAHTDKYTTPIARRICNRSSSLSQRVIVSTIPSKSIDDTSGKVEEVHPSYVESDSDPVQTALHEAKKRWTNSIGNHELALIITHSAFRNVTDFSGPHSHNAHNPESMLPNVVQLSCQWFERQCSMTFQPPRFLALTPSQDCRSPVVSHLGGVDSLNLDDLQNVGGNFKYTQDETSSFMFTYQHPQYFPFSW
ncbi:hypothetical protein EDC04DRAFT_3100812 [Pisolithus marmoratus]|nr:hypothetical protein EDC04DRAFT_3100812 [Pisolithus marmoratus]